MVWRGITWKSRAEAAVVGMVLAKNTGSRGGGCTKND